MVEHLPPLVGCHLLIQSPSWSSGLLSPLLKDWEWRCTLGSSSSYYFFQNLYQFPKLLITRLHKRLVTGTVMKAAFCSRLQRRPLCCSMLMPPYLRKKGKILESGKSVSFPRAIKSHATVLCARPLYWESISGGQHLISPGIKLISEQPLLCLLV